MKEIYTEPLKIVMVTLPNEGFGGSGGSSKKNKISLIVQALNVAGYSVSVVCITDLLESTFSPDTVIIYTSSDEPNIRKYITDIIRIVSKRYRVIPSFDSLLAHENKGFQELFRSETGFGNLTGTYVFDYDDLPDGFPYVYKAITGAGSKNVHLVSSAKDKEKIKKKYFKVPLVRRLILMLRRLHYSNVEFDNYQYRHKGYSLGVVQEFIPNLSGDFKVLIFGRRYYVLHRSIRPNDFRASGSGLLSFQSVDDNLLDFAESIFDALNEPFVSLDIAESAKGFHLIEYQVLNFGPYTLKESPGHYERDVETQAWKFNEGKASLELEFARAIDVYLRKNQDFGAV